MCRFDNDIFLFFQKCQLGFLFFFIHFLKPLSCFSSSFSWWFVFCFFLPPFFFPSFLLFSFLSLKVETEVSERDE